MRTHHLALIVLMASASPVEAAVLSYAVSGFIHLINDPAGEFANVQVGDPYTGIIQYDPTWPIVEGGDIQSVYEPDPTFVTAVFEVGDMLITTDPQGVALGLVNNDRYDILEPLSGDVVVFFQSAIPPPQFTGSGPMLLWYVRDPDGLPLTSNDLPSELRLEDWPLAELGFTSGDFRWDVSGPIKTMTRVIFYGDTNGDLRVDLDDLNNVRNNFGGNGLGDSDGDGDVDIDDLNAVRNNFGAGMVVVPEPGAGGLAVCGLAWLVAALNRRRGFRLSHHA